ncbi:MAG: THUMP domain-containing protein [Lentisphaeria bacterium]
MREELCELGLKGARLNSGGIPFHGEREDAWYACLHSRIAQRIQLQLTKSRATSPKELYELARGIDWTPYISPSQTVAVGIYCRSRYFTHSGATALTVKDAIVDQLRDTLGERPNVDRDDPDVRIFVYISEDKVKLYLDLSGEPLHKRGYRQETGPAPIRENLAAALIRLSGWDRESPLADPLCGSGTIAIEAALWAGNTAPGLFREKFGFERWADFDDDSRQRMHAMREDAWAGRNKQIPQLLASDADPEVLKAAQTNAKAAGLRLRFRQTRIEDLQLSGKVRTVVTNPPYDERLETSRDTFREIGAAFSRMHGVRLGVLTGNSDLDKYIPVATVQRLPMKNGNIDCEFCVYRIP